MPVRTDLRRRSRAFALADRELALVEEYAEQEGFTKSQALRQLLKLAEQHVSADVTRGVARRRVVLVEKAREQQRQRKKEPIPVVVKCPACGDVDLYIEFPDGTWRCDSCLASG